MRNQPRFVDQAGNPVVLQAGDLLLVNTRSRQLRLCRDSTHDQSLMFVFDHGVSAKGHALTPDFYLDEPAIMTLANLMAAAAGLDFEIRDREPDYYVRFFAKEVE